jgi:hypothetical protein
MRIAIKIARPLRLRKLTEFIKINDVSVYVHWSVLLISGLMLSNSIRRPVLTLVGVTAWLSVILIHECGHLIAAHRRGCAVFSIELYPIFGITHFQTPWSRFDHCVIAWGGVLAQAVIAIPLAAWLAIVGYTRFEPINAVLAILGFYSLAVAASTCFLLLRWTVPSPGRSYRHSFSVGGNGEIGYFPNTDLRDEGW